MEHTPRARNGAAKAPCANTNESSILDSLLGWNYHRLQPTRSTRERGGERLERRGRRAEAASRGRDWRVGEQRRRGKRRVRENEVAEAEVALHDSAGREAVACGPNQG